jgi:hypothetical protein|eukprot:COSAG01_NODE_3951_length_5501_cov_3.287116_8_plen_91_part_00
MLSWLVSRMLRSTDCGSATALTVLLQLREAVCRRFRTKLANQHTQQLPPAEPQARASRPPATVSPGVGARNVRPAGGAGRCEAAASHTDV